MFFGTLSAFVFVIGSSGDLEMESLFFIFYLDTDTSPVGGGSLYFSDVQF